MNQVRLNKVVCMMTAKNLGQMLVSDPSSIYYLTGQWIHPGERMLALYIDCQGNYKLFLNELFKVPQNLGVEIIYFNDTDDSVKMVAQAINPRIPVGIDKNWSAHFLLELMSYNQDGVFLNSSGILDHVRMCKDAQEQVAMRESSRLNDLAMDQLIRFVPKQYTERQLAQQLSGIYEAIGADGYSFAPIIAYGENASDPHHQPDRRILQSGDCIVMDIGCKKDAYCSDMTRTVFYQSASDHARKVYNIVLEANKRAIAAVRPGVRFCDIDAVARNYIEAAGYGKGFVHRTGHSVGLDVHDFGDVSAVNTNLVQPGNIFSIEPCVVIPGELGIRVEDLVLVTEEGSEVLNKYNKELMIID